MHTWESTTPRSACADLSSVCWLQDAKEAKEVLIEMARSAAEALGVPFKNEESLMGLDPETDTTWGLARDEMGKKRLVGTVKRYDTHLFVIWKTAAEWPKNADQGDDSSLPAALAKAMSERKNSIVGKVRGVGESKRGGGGWGTGAAGWACPREEGWWWCGSAELTWLAVG